MKKKRSYYQTYDKTANYLFSFEEQRNGTWRVYVLQQPSYQSRATNNHAIHMLSDGSKQYICWDSPIQTFSEATRVAALWAEKTIEYIRTGKSF